MDDYYKPDFKKKKVKDMKKEVESLFSQNSQNLQIASEFTQTYSKHVNDLNNSDDGDMVATLMPHSVALMMSAMNVLKTQFSGNEKQWAQQFVPGFVQHQFIAQTSNPGAVVSKTPPVPRISLCSVHKVDSATNIPTSGNSTSNTMIFQSSVSELKSELVARGIPDSQLTNWESKSSPILSSLGNQFVDVSQCLAVCAYTSNYIFNDLNKRMRSGDFSQTTLYQHTIFHLCSAIRNFLCPTSTIFYRGQAQSFGVTYDVGAFVTWTAFTSVSTNSGVAKGFSGGGIVFEISGLTAGAGASVQKISVYPSEEEIIVMPGAVFEVISNSNNYVKLKFVSLDGKCALPTSIDHCSVCNLEMKIRRSDITEATNIINNPDFCEYCDNYTNIAFDKEVQLVDTEKKIGTRILHLVAAQDSLHKLLQLFCGKFGKLQWDNVNNDGETALHVAVRNKAYENVKYLLEFLWNAGLASVIRSPNKAGKTAKEMAAGDTKMSQLFERF